MKPYTELERCVKLGRLALCCDNGSYSKEQCAELLNVGAINVEPNERIYHIIKLDYFLKMLKSGSLRMTHPSDWDDPWEDPEFCNFARYDHPKQLSPTTSVQDVDLSAIRKSSYAMCWTLRKECDGLWRAYTDNMRYRAIRISTTVGKLFREFYRFEEPICSNRYFIGRVEYCSEENLVKERDKFFSQPLVHLKRIMTLFKKRDQFDYEQEVRLIYDDAGEVSDCRKLPKEHFHKVDLSKIVDEVTLDPWCGEEELEMVRGYVSSLGFSFQIDVSKLYSEITTPAPIHN